jgi:hypothetical protein
MNQNDPLFDTEISMPPGRDTPVRQRDTTQKKLIRSFVNYDNPELSSELYVLPPGAVAPQLEKFSWVADGAIYDFKLTTGRLAVTDIVDGYRVETFITFEPLLIKRTVLRSTLRSRLIRNNKSKSTLVVERVQDVYDYEPDRDTPPERTLELVSDVETRA